MKRALVSIAAAVLLGMAAIGCGSSDSDGQVASTDTSPTTAAAATKTITGSVTDTSMPCQVAGWSVGDPVVILDGPGKLLAEGEITGQSGDRDQTTRCDLAWEVKDVPEGASGYQVRVADEEPVAYDWAQLLDDPQLVKG